MNKRFLITVGILVALVGISTPITAYANPVEPPPPTIVTDPFGGNGSKLIMPESVVYGPDGKQVAISNRYFPWYASKVKTDGWADANFQQPSLHRITCKSRVYNTSGQNSGWATTYGSIGGTDCGPTPQVVINNAVKPSTYTSQTQAFWYWTSSSQGSGLAEQVHNE